MTDKQRRFADEYLIDCNATRAYKAAYPSVKQDATAAQAGSRMFKYEDNQALCECMALLLYHFGFPVPAQQERQRAWKSLKKQPERKKHDYRKH